MYHQQYDMGDMMDYNQQYTFETILITAIASNLGKLRPLFLAIECSSWSDAQDWDDHN